MILIVLFKTSAVWLISNSPTILLRSAIAFNRSCKQVYRMWDGMSAFKPSPVMKSDKLSYCCKQCSMTLLRKASALHVSCSIRMGLGRDPLSLSTCRVGSRATTTLLKNTCRRVWCCTQSGLRLSAQWTGEWVLLLSALWSVDTNGL